MSRICVVGSGAWGTALAISLHARGGHRVALWSHTPALADAMRTAGENTVYLPGFAVSPDIAIETDLMAAAGEAEFIVGAMPSSHVRSLYTAMARHLRPGQVVVSATKGIESSTLLRMSEVIAQVCGERGLRLPIAVLSGPSFAQEVAAGMPTAITLACEEPRCATRIQAEFSSPNLRLYTHCDVIGVELGGALKNVIALATGVVAGLGLGHNTAAALMTRGIAEITRLAVACGGQRETLAGLAGVGDLVLTCTGALSRNRKVGFELGKGKTLAQSLRDLDGKVAEGVGTAAAALGLARRHSVEMPITEQIHAVLHCGKPPIEAVRELMCRPGREEF